MIRDAIATATRRLATRGAWRLMPLLGGRGPAVADIPGVGAIALDLDDPAQRQIYWLGLDHSNRAIIDLAGRFTRPGGTALDIGGFLGTISIGIARVIAGRGGRVITFEPNPHNRRAIRGNLDRNDVGNVMLVPRGLSDHNHEIVGRGGPSAHNWSVASTGPEAFPIELTTLDGYAGSHDLGRVDFVKLDVEGCEVAAIRGAEATLRRFRPPIVFELNPYWLGRMGATAEALIDAMESLGYESRRLARHGKAGGAFTTRDARRLGAGEWLDLVAIPRG